MKNTHAAYSTWVGGATLTPPAPWAMPDCWCYEWQCRGDADGKPLSPYVPAIKVSLVDLNILRAAIGKSYDAVDWPAGGICADFDMLPLSPYVPKVRVSLADLNILRQWISQNNPPSCDSAHINFWIVP